MRNIIEGRLEGTFTVHWEDGRRVVEFRRAAAVINELWALMRRKQEEREDTCTVLVNCNEKGRLRLHTGTYVVGQEGMHPLMHVLLKGPCRVNEAPCLVIMRIELECKADVNVLRMRRLHRVCAGLEQCPGLRGGRQRLSRDGHEQQHGAGTQHSSLRPDFPFFAVPALLGKGCCGHPGFVGCHACAMACKGHGTRKP